MKRAIPCRAGACPVPVILDTDTYNEIDDQFALVYALLTPECINLRGVTAAPFLNSRSTSAADGWRRVTGKLSGSSTSWASAAGFPLIAVQRRFCLTG